MDKSPNAWVISLCFMDQLSKFSASQPYNPGTATQGKDIQPDKDLRTHWKNPYLGSACVRLRDTVQNYQQKSSPEFYSKTIYLLQSSGAGKSRMAHKYGNMVPMVTFVIRDPTIPAFHPPMNRYSTSFGVTRILWIENNWKSTLDPERVLRRQSRIERSGYMLLLLASFKLPLNNVCSYQ